jgi:hypothetical protein
MPEPGGFLRERAAKRPTILPTDVSYGPTESTSLRPMARAIDSGKPRNEPTVNLTISKLEPERRKTLTSKKEED